MIRVKPALARHARQPFFEALVYAIHTQKDRRNLSDAEILRLIELIDQPQDGFHSTIAAFEAIGDKPRKTAELTADAIGTSRAKVERARTVLADPEATEAVRRGEMLSIHQAAQHTKLTRQSTKMDPSESGMNIQPKVVITEKRAAKDVTRILTLLGTLEREDSDRRRRAAYRTASATLAKAIKSK